MEIKEKKTEKRTHWARQRIRKRDRNRKWKVAFKNVLLTFICFTIGTFATLKLIYVTAQNRVVKITFKN